MCAGEGVRFGREPKCVRGKMVIRERPFDFQGGGGGGVWSGWNVFFTCFKRQKKKFNWWHLRAISTIFRQWELCTFSDFHFHSRS